MNCGGRTRRILYQQSCQGSQTLHFMTSLRVSEYVGDGEVLLMLLRKAGVTSHFLVPYKIHRPHRSRRICCLEMMCEAFTMSCLLGHGDAEEEGRFLARIQEQCTICPERNRSFVGEYIRRRWHLGVDFPT